MNNRFALVAALALCIGAFGCASTKAVNDAGQRLTVFHPSNETISQGDKGEVNIRVSRDRFDAPLEVDVADLPAGIKLLNENMTIERHESTFTLDLVAEPTAPVVSDHIVHVTVTGPDGLTATESFRISVEAGR